MLVVASVILSGVRDPPLSTGENVLGIVSRDFGLARGEPCVVRNTYRVRLPTVPLEIGLMT